MAVYWVNYDLNKSGQDYPNLISYLESHEDFAKPLKSSFFVKTSLTAAQLGDGIRDRVDSSDDVVVINVDEQVWLTLGIGKEITDWMRANILP